MTKEKRRILIVGSLVAFAVVAFVIWANPRSGYVFPPASSITSMEAKVFDSLGTNDRVFLVPANLYQEVLSALSPSRYDRFPAKWQILGDLRIRTVEVESIQVFLFDLSNQEVGAFAAGPDWESRQYCRGGNSARLRAALEKAFMQSTTR